MCIFVSSFVPIKPHSVLNGFGVWWISLLRFVSQPRYSRVRIIELKPPEIALALFENSTIQMFCRQ